MKQVDFINGVEVNEANNYALNELELNFDPKQAGSKATLSVNNWELGVGDYGKPNDASRMAYAHMENGLTGGVGVTEGLPYRKVIRQAGNDIEIFNGFLNMWTAKYQPLEGKVTAQAVEKGKLGWLESGVADFSFEYLASLEEFKEIIKEKTFLVPYVKQNSDEFLEALIAVLIVGDVLYKLESEIEGILELTAEGANPFEASAIARLVLRIIYIATLLVALIKLFLDAYYLLIQPVKYHAVMYVNDLLRIGAAHLGLTYSSSVLEAAPFDKLAILPKKHFTKKNTDGIFAGVKGLFEKDKTGQKGYPGQDYTFAQLLQAIQNAFYAKIICNDGINLRIEKQNFTLSTPKYKIPAVERTGGYTFNEDEFYSNTVIQFATDGNDKNTMQQYLGTLYQVEVVQISSINPTMRLTKRLRTIYIDFALAKRKTELTFPEKIFDAFLKVAGEIVEALVIALNAIIDVLNAIIKTLNKIIKSLHVVGIDVDFQIPTLKNIDPPAFGNLIEDRLGMMVMENDYVDVMKWLLVDNNSDARNNKLRPENEDVLRAKYLWDNFWFLSSFVPQPGNESGNQWIRYPIEKVPFTYEDWNLVRNDNMITDTDNKTGRINTCKFNIDEQSAGLDFSINQTYTKNLIELKFEPDGK